MKTFANQIKSYRRTRHSFCSRMLKAFVLMFVMVGLAQAEVKKLPCSPTKELRIDKPGDYVLIEDCAVTSDGITITASEVQLNLDGHTLSGPGCGPRSTGITVFGSNVHVTGGIVKDFQTGVTLRTISASDDGSADHNQLSRLKVTENCTGIELRFSNNNHVNFNDVSGNLQDAVEDGVVVQRGDGVVVQRGSDNNQIEFNVINENRRGILVSDSDSNVLAFNTISRNVGGGVTLFLSDPADGQVGGSNNNTIAGNVVTETKESGITVQVGKGNTINGNLSSRNEVGIRLGLRASGNFVLRNTALGSRKDMADLVDENPQCDGNTWKSNNFVTDLVDGRPDDGPRAGCIQ